MDWFPAGAGGERRAGLLRAGRTSPVGKREQVRERIVVEGGLDLGEGFGAGQTFAAVEDSDDVSDHAQRLPGAARVDPLPGWLVLLEQSLGGDRGRADGFDLLLGRTCGEVRGTVRHFVEVLHVLRDLVLGVAVCLFLEGCDRCLTDGLFLGAHGGQQAHVAVADLGLLSQRRLHLAARQFQVGKLGRLVVPESQCFAAQLGDALGGRQVPRARHRARFGVAGRVGGW